MDLHGKEQELAAADTSRPMYWFTIPAKLAAQTSVQRLGLVELKPNEELMAARRASGDQLLVAQEVVKESLRRVNDDRMSTADGTTDTFWGRSSPGFAQIRQHLMTAYMRIHQVAQEDTDSFLDSMKLVLG